jgi:hypothetical protein
MARSRLVVGAVLATANVRDCCDSSRLCLFRGLCLPSLRSAFLPSTHLAFTMWLARDHLPLALLAPGLSGSKCVVIGELQPQRDNLLGFTTSAGFNHEPFAPNYAWSSIVAIVGILAVAVGFVLGNGLTEVFGLNSPSPPRAEHRLFSRVNDSSTRG